MLFNPKWNTKPAMFSRNGLVAWLKTKPPTETYDYLSYETCLAAQFHAACGLEYAPPNPFLFWKWFTTFTYRLERVAMGYPRTFGAALSRARAL
jgi:hypothetical protein